MGTTLLLAALACKAPSKSEPGNDPPSAAPSASQPEAAATKPKPIVVHPRDLLADYKANEVRADAKYKGKRVIVIGVVDEIKKDVLDSIYVIVAPPECVGHRLENPKCGIEQVQAFFEDDQTSVAAGLDKGKVVAFDCTVEGLMMNVILKKCSLAKRPDGTPLEVPSDSPSATAPTKKKRN